MDLLSEIVDRARPVSEAVPLEGTPLLLTLLVAAAAILVDPLWRILRVAITLVHELGHAFVGVLVGRRFTGFVVRADMSGHAVTSGKPRGFGRIVTTWAGYPMPALVGAAMVLLAESGWGASLLTALLALVLVAFVRIRSALTLLVMLAALAGIGTVWWWRDDALQAHVLVAAGIVLIAGAWRHLGAVLRGGRQDRSSDPAVLAILSWLPRSGWVLSFVVVLALATAVAAMTIRTGLAV